MAKPVISDTLAVVINNAIHTRTFPDEIKKIEPRSDCGYGDHPGVKIIREHLAQNLSLSFRHTNENEVATILHSLNPKKATGPDKIPPKLIKMAKPVISDTLALVINAGVMNYTRVVLTVQCVFSGRSRN